MQPKQYAAYPDQFYKSMMKECWMVKWDLGIQMAWKKISILLFNLLWYLTYILNQADF